MRKNNTRRFLPDEVFETVEDALETIEFLMAQYATGEGPYVYPVLLKDDTNIGYVQLVPIEEGWEIGYHIAKQYTGKGYATEAVSKFMPEIAAKKNIYEIHGICLKENAGSVKVMEKCGFEITYRGMGNYQGQETDIVKAVWKI